MRPNNNKDRMLRRFLPWVLLFGIIMMSYWLLRPNPVTQEDNIPTGQSTILAENEEVNQGDQEVDNFDQNIDQNEQINDQSPVETSSGKFVKHVFTLSNQKNYWIALQKSDLNPVLIKQLQQLKDKISLASVTGLDILYSDYVQADNHINAKNSKTLAVIIKMGENQQAYYSYEDGNGLRFYDYQGNAPVLTMDRNPFRYTRVNSNFNLHRKHPVTGRVQPHKGVDLKGAYGTSIHTTGDGIVTFAGWQSGYGRTITINHRNGYETKYAHLSAINVSQGQTVKRGQVIGKLGNSGLSTGAHLHYEVLVNGTPNNPLTVKLPTYRPLSRANLKSLQYYANQYNHEIKELTKQHSLVSNQ